MSLDYGDKRIGVAIGNTNNKIAFVRPYFLNNDQIYSQITNLCEQEKISQIIIGQPFLLNGDQSVSADKVQIFLEKLAHYLQVRSIFITIKLVDERFSTKIAHKNLIMGECKAKNKKKYIDSISAQIILENYLHLI